MTAHERLLETLVDCGQLEAAQYIREMGAENVALNEQVGMLAAERDQLRDAIRKFHDATDKWWDRGNGPAGCAEAGAHESRR